MWKNSLLVGILFGLVAGTISKEAKAQDPEFTQFYANKLYLNPAFAGSHNCPRVVMNYRNNGLQLPVTMLQQPLLMISM